MCPIAQRDCSTPPQLCLEGGARLDVNLTGRKINVSPSQVENFASAHTRQDTKDDDFLEPGLLDGCEKALKVLRTQKQRRLFGDRRQPHLIAWI